MSISVVVPAYNEENWIHPCLISLVNQIQPADEIIVVNNNSTDKTAAICKQFPVRVIKEKNQGKVFARNTGFNSASSEIIARCDADSLLPADWIKKIQGAFSSRSIVGLSGPAYFYDLAKIDKRLLIQRIYFVANRLLLGHEVLFGSNMAIAKAAWLNVKDSVCTDETKIHEDLDLAIHLAAYGKIFYDKNLVVGISARRIRINPGSVFFEYPIRDLRTILNHRKTFHGPWGQTFSAL